jgi:hypothetical protein
VPEHAIREAHDGEAARAQRAVHLGEEAQRARHVVDRDHVGDLRSDSDALLVGAEETRREGWLAVERTNHIESMVVEGQTEGGALVEVVDDELGELLILLELDGVHAETDAAGGTEVLGKEAHPRRAAVEHSNRVTVRCGRERATIMLGQRVDRVVVNMRAQNRRKDRTFASFSLHAIRSLK